MVLILFCSVVEQSKSIYTICQAIYMAIVLFLMQLSNHNSYRKLVQTSIVNIHHSPAWSYAKLLQWFSPNQDARIATSSDTDKIALLLSQNRYCTISQYLSISICIYLGGLSTSVSILDIPSLNQDVRPEVYFKYRFTLFGSSLWLIIY